MPVSSGSRNSHGAVSPGSIEQVNLQGNEQIASVPTETSEPSNLNQIEGSPAKKREATRAGLMHNLRPRIVAKSLQAPSPSNNVRQATLNSEAQTTAEDIGNGVIETGSNRTLVEDNANDHPNTQHIRIFKPRCADQTAIRPSDSNDHHHLHHHERHSPKQADHRLPKAGLADLVPLPSAVRQREIMTKHPTLNVEREQNSDPDSVKLPRNQNISRPDDNWRVRVEYAWAPERLLSLQSMPMQMPYRTLQHTEAPQIQTQCWRPNTQGNNPSDESRHTNNGRTEEIAPVEQNLVQQTASAVNQKLIDDLEKLSKSVEDMQKRYQEDQFALAQLTEAACKLGYVAMNESLKQTAFDEQMQALQVRVQCTQAVVNETNKTAHDLCQSTAAHNMVQASHQKQLEELKNLIQSSITAAQQSVQAQAQDANVTSAAETLGDISTQSRFFLPNQFNLVSLPNQLPLQKLCSIKFTRKCNLLQDIFRMLQ